MVERVKLPTDAGTLYMSTSPSAAAPFSTELPANTPGKAADSPGVWGPPSPTEGMELLGPGFSLTRVRHFVGICGVSQHTAVCLSLSL